MNVCILIASDVLIQRASVSITSNDGWCSKIGRSQSKFAQVEPIVAFLFFGTVAGNTF